MGIQLVMGCQTSSCCGNFSALIHLLRNPWMSTMHCRKPECTHVLFMQDAGQERQSPLHTLRARPPLPCGSVLQGETGSGTFRFRSL